MRCPYKNDDYRKHFAAHRRAMTAPQHDYDGKGPIIKNGPHRREHDAEIDLVRYAAALGRARGQLPADLTEFGAWGIRHDDGTGAVMFTRGRYVRGRYGEEWRQDPEATPVRIEVRNLHWQPEPATEELLYEVAE
jgi:hypothetical protein